MPAEPRAGHETIDVHVRPAAALARHARLLDALSRWFPVRFVPEPADAGAESAPAIVFAADATAAEEARDALHTGLVFVESASRGTRAEVRLGGDARVDPRLRGRRLEDHRARGAAVPARPGEAVLAEGPDGPLWVAAAAEAHRVDLAAAPEPLAPDAGVRDAFRDGRFLAVLALIDALRRWTAASAWESPPLRAALVVDDPNLHWPSYGYLDFADADRAAAEHGYHLAIAMVPLDGWFAHPRAADTFRRSERLSLLFHGHTHVREELARPRTLGAAVHDLERAVARVRAFERRAGLDVSPVMAPPHGSCAPVTLDALRRTEIAAMCMNRPHPWRDRPPASRPLACTAPGDWVRGFPVIGRHKLAASPADLALTAYLDRPLVVYGHHGDLRHGLRVLAEAAREINDLGPVRWESLGAIARSNLLSRREGRRLRVRPYSRDVEVDVPDGVDELVVELPDGLTGQTDVQIHAGGEAAGGAAERRSLEDCVPVAPGPTRIALREREHRSALNGTRPPAELWPVARRLAVEVRDRFAPALARRPRVGGRR
ncbi:MAG TPA: hypothetical protein VGN78_13115 [Solirubrobacteraceae bacterium]|nr:hypothetical protein [Solirubrobacteraceae bacterium]